MSNDSAANNLSQLKLEAYRLSERCLESETALSVASDQRAMSFCGIVIAGAAILTGLIDSENPNYGLLLAAFILTISAGFAGFAARPVKFYAPGAKFEDFMPDIENNEAYLSVIQELAQFNDQHSLLNRNKMDRNAVLLYIAFFVALAGLFVALISQINFEALILSSDHPKQ